MSWGSSWYVTNTDQYKSLIIKQTSLIIHGHTKIYQRIHDIFGPRMTVQRYTRVGESTGYTPRRGIAGSSESVMSSLLRNCHTDFLGGCTILQSHQQWRSVHLFPNPYQHLLSPEFLTLAILTGVRWNLRDDLICIALMTNDVEHFLRWFSGIWISSGRNSLFRSLLHF